MWPHDNSATRSTGAKWQAVLIVLRNILSVGIVTRQWVPITFMLFDYHYVSDSTQ